MPAALEVDHEAVKMVALQIGVREAARQFGLSEEVVMKWSQREKWFAQKDLVEHARAIKIERQGLSAVVRKTPSEVLSNLGNRSKLRAAKVGDKALSALQKRDGEGILKGSTSYLNTVNALAKVHGWGAESATSAPLVSVNILSANVPDVTHVADA